MMSVAADNNHRQRILVVAGEASGDLHGANLIKAAREHFPGLSFFGIGGPKMRAAGCDIIFPAEKLAVMGLVEVLGRLLTIWRAFCLLRGLLRGAQRPDLVILIDYPGFNLRFAKRARQAGIPVLYYIAPKVWAWKKGRIRTIAARVDKLALIFPFEPELYQGFDLDVEYVGNPLLDECQRSRDRRQFALAQGLDPAAPLVGLFPGSRGSEIRYMFDTLLESARLLVERGVAKQFLLPVAPGCDFSALSARVVAAGLPITLVEENIYDVAGACDAILCVSGTVTLQVALVGTPLAIIYQGAALTYAIGRQLVKIPYFGLPNIVVGREVAREFLQEAASPAALAAEIQRLLADEDYRQAACAGLAEVRRRLGGPGCSRRVAAIAASMCTAKDQKEVS